MIVTAKGYLAQTRRHRVILQVLSLPTVLKDCNCGKVLECSIELGTCMSQTYISVCIHFHYDLAAILLMEFWSTDTIMSLWFSRMILIEHDEAHANSDEHFILRVSEKFICHVRERMMTLGYQNVEERIISLLQ